MTLIIVFATTGQEAVDKAKKNTYALIWMDVGLPDFSGIEVTKKIRAFTDPKKSTVPIVALTAHANNPAMRQEALDAGMQDVIQTNQRPSGRVDGQALGKANALPKARPYNHGHNKLLIGKTTKSPKIYLSPVDVGVIIMGSIAAALEALGILE